MKVALSRTDWGMKEVYESVDIIGVGGMRVSGLQAYVRHARLTSRSCPRRSRRQSGYCRRDRRGHERLVLVELLRLTENELPAAMSAQRQCSLEHAGNEALRNEHQEGGGALGEAMIVVFQPANKEL